MWWRRWNAQLKPNRENSWWLPCAALISLSQLRPHSSASPPAPLLCLQVVVKEDNPDFIAMVEKKFPNKETKFLVGCSNGTQYSIDALEALDEAGYYNLVGLK